MKVTKEFLFRKKLAGEAITMLTAYDYPAAQIEDEAGVDVILVGDSVGTNVLGYKSEQEVTMADMMHHCKAVSRGVEKAYIIVDMPYESRTNPFKALEYAELLLNCGADCVKVEGWAEIKPVVECMTGKGINVCGHIGYNPQVHGIKAKVFGKDACEAEELIESSRILEAAGASMLIIEKVPAEIAAIITKERKIPVIGIGSGGYCNGQVLVLHDILGFGSRTYKHARKYMDFRNIAFESILSYCNDVHQKKFPSEQNLHHMNQAELEKVEQYIRKSVSNKK